MAVTLVRQGATEWRWRYDTTWGYGEFQTVNVAPSGTPIAGLNGVWAVENNIRTMLVDPQWVSVWEYATAIGMGGAAHETFAYFGGGHGNQQSTFGAISVDNADAGGTAVGNSVSGNQIVMQQQLNILLPADNTVVCGTVVLTHTLTSSGMRVRSDYIMPSPSPYEWFDSRTAMLPAGLFDRIQFDQSPVESVIGFDPPRTRDRGSRATLMRASSTQHPYQIAMSLPTGSPNTTGTWTDTGLDGAYWFDQQFPKIYANDISTDFNLRKTASSRSHITDYEIRKVTSSHAATNSLRVLLG